MKNLTYKNHEAVLFKYILLLMVALAVPLQAGLVGYWGFETDGDITVVSDGVNSYDGSVVGNVTADPNGIKGMALSFDSSYVVIDNALLSEHIQNYPFSISCWVRVESQSSSTYAAIWLGNSKSFSQYFQVGPRMSRGIMVGRNEPYCDFDTGLTQSSVLVDDSKWHHMVAVFASEVDRRLYIDGYAAGTGSALCPFPDSLDMVTFGCNARKTGPTDFMEGSLDEVRVFDHALSLTEVKGLYLADQAIAYWPCDSVTGSEYTQRYQSTVSGVLSLVEGVRGSACYFDGSNYISVSSDICADIPDYPFSMAYWFKVSEQGQSTYAACWLGNKYVSDQYFQTGVRRGKAMLTARNTNFDLGLVESPLELDDDGWHSAVAVFDSINDRRLYIDGTLVSEDIDEVNFVSHLNRFTIGRNSRSSATDYFIGALDEVYVYNKAITDDIVSGLYTVARIGLEQVIQARAALPGENWNTPGIWPDNMTPDMQTAANYICNSELYAPVGDTVFAGQALTLNGTLFLTDQAVVIDGLFVDDGTLTISGDCVIDGNIEVVGDLYIVFADTDSSLTIASEISGLGNIVIAAGGEVVLSAANSSFAGQWLVNGKLTASADDSLGMGNITAASGAWLDIDYDLLTTAGVALEDGSTTSIDQNVIIGSLVIDGQEMAYGNYSSLYLYQLYDNMFVEYAGGSGSVSVGPVLALMQHSDGATQVSEAGAVADTFSVVLAEQPAGQVTVAIDPQLVALTQNDIQLSGTVSPGQPLVLSFDSANWNIPQIVTVLPVVDGIVEPVELAGISSTIRYNDTVIGVAIPLLVEIFDSEPSGLLADLDNDHQVAIGDLYLLAQAWLQNAGFNLAGSSEIQLDDFAVLSKQWGTVSRPDALSGYTSHLVNGNEILFNCGLSQVKLTMCNSRMVRVQLAPDRQYRSDSHPDYFMVQKFNWPQVDFDVTDEGSYIKVATADMVVRAQKSPFGLQMYEADNTTLLAKDDDQQGMYWQNNVVGVKRIEGPGSGGKFGFGGGDHGNAGLLNKNGGFDQFTVTHGRVPVPFFMSTAGYGIFLNTVAKGTAFDASGGFATEDYLDYWFMAGPSFKSILADYSELTGKMALFPKWAYGFMLSKYGNDNATQAEFIDWINWLRFGGHPSDDGGGGWPIDCYVFDYGWRGAKWNPHRWDPARYPDLENMFAQADALGFHVGLHNNYGTPEADNGNFTDPVTADKWWQAHLNPVIAPGFGDWFWPDEFDVVGDNLMANRSAKVVHEKWLEYTTQQRPMFITRGGYAGHHYACAWSGDIENSISEMNKQIVNQQAVGLSGYPWFSHDLGGFKAKPSDNLYIRWVAEFGSFCSIMRAHGHDGREPWLYSANAQSILRKYLNLRYKLFPYIYTTAWQGYSAGIPMMRAMALEYQNDTVAWTKQNQYFWGDWFLVAPALSENATNVSVWIPAGDWYDYFKGTKYTGPQNITVSAQLDEIPVFVKAGAIIPTGPAIRYADELPLDEITLDIYPVIGNSTYTLYEDDGITRNYLIDNAYSLTQYDYENTGDIVRFVIGAAQVNAPELYSPVLPRDYYCRFNYTEAVPVLVTANSTTLNQYTDESSFRLAQSGWYFDSEANILWVKIVDDGDGCVLTIQ